MAEPIKTIKNVKEKLISDNSLSSYLNIYKELQNLGKKDLEEIKNIRVAVLGSSTLHGIKEALYVKCHLLGLNPLLYVSDYNQYNQEILDDKSQFYTFQPDLVILWISIDTLLSENFYFPYRLNSGDRKTLIDKSLKTVTELIRKIKNKTSAKVVLHNFRIPTNSSMGILESKEDYGIKEAVLDLNNRLSETYKKDNQVFVFDFESFLSNYGKSNVEEEKLRYSADIRVKPDYIPLLCQEYLAYIKPLKSLNKKCLVLDLDNTLWGGVVGEDGFEGIQLGPKPPGNAFFEFHTG